MEDSTYLGSPAEDLGILAPTPDLGWGVVVSTPTKFVFIKLWKAGSR